MSLPRRLVYRGQRYVAAGWWPATDSGRINWQRPAPRATPFINVAPGEQRGPVVGDWPADILSEALDKVAAAYQHDHGRPPTHEELLRCWRFVTNPIAEGTRVWDAKQQQYVSKPREQ